MNEKYSNFLKTICNDDGVFYLGHASILVSLSGKKILFDPILLASPYSDAWTFYPSQIKDPRFYEVDCVVISHMHQDHYDVQFLKKINGDIPIIIIGGRPSFEEDLKFNGINRVTIIEPEKITKILDDVFIFGVNHESNGIDSSCLVYSSNFCVYHGNDNFLTKDSLLKYLKLDLQIDVACIPYAYISWYPFLLEYDLDQAHIKEQESLRLVRMYMDDCIESTKLLNPQLVIPFGANLVLDDGSAFSDINLAVKTPLEFIEYADEKAPELRDVIKAMHAGDSCIKSNGVIKTTIDKSLVSDSYRQAADEFLKARAALPRNYDFKDVNLNEFINKLNLKIIKSDITLNQTIRMELSYFDKTILIEIDCLKKLAKLVDQFTTKTNYHHYKLDHIASGYWLNGKRFEEIIGMRRFRIKRVPNLYSQEMIKFTTTVI
jgi:L-ascorbate metabolism protein UlaG (beta-lactamase superfamily)